MVLCGKGTWAGDDSGEWWEDPSPRLHTQLHTAGRALGPARNQSEAMRCGGGKLLETVCPASSFLQTARPRMGLGLSEATKLVYGGLAWGPGSWCLVQSLSISMLPHLSQCDTQLQWPDCEPRAIERQMPRQDDGQEDFIGRSAVWEEMGREPGGWEGRRTEIRV